MTHSITLIGDNIENPANARTMMAASQMFDSGCVFRDRKSLLDTVELSLMTQPEIVAQFATLVALDNSPGAGPVYGFQVPQKQETALIVGNERRGIARDLTSIAHHSVEIPMVSKKINCLNVSAAAAVGLYYLSRGGGGKMQVRNNPSKRRPELLLMSAKDPIELGSSIRSACAFGWGRAFVDDRHRIWFGCDRVVRSEGRGAARRGRNPIRLIPTSAKANLSFREVCVITSNGDAIPLHRANLARGPSQLIVIPDESGVDLESETFDHLGQGVQFVKVGIPGCDYPYHYRLNASIALAEIARQVGQKAKHDRGRPKRHEPFYDKRLRVVSKEAGEIVYLEELMDY